MTEAATEFRHKIGDALYDLFEDFEGQLDSWVQVYPVAKITDRYVWVNGCHRWDADRLMRFSRDDLERTGRAWNQSQRLGLRTRPMPDWPILLVSNERANVLEAPRD